MLNTNCGSASTDHGITLDAGGCNTTTWFNGYNWTYPYAYASQTEVAELRGKVDALEKMVAALLSGVKIGSAPSRRRK